MAPRPMRPRRPNRRLSVGNLQRIVILGILFGVVTFGILFAKLWQLQVVEHDTLTERAVKQQTRVTTSNAHRGTIFDANGDVLAISGSVKNVVLSPRDILAAVEVDTTDEFGNPRSQTVIDAERTQKAQEKIDIIAEGMADILNIDPNIIYQKVQEKPNSAWQVIAEKVPDETGDEVNAFVEENDLKGCVYCTDDSKRYYPYSYLATQVVGFVNSENQGAYGVEALYNNELSGENGRTITSKNASGREMLSKYADRSTTQNGYNVNLTIDTTIQLYAETVLEQGIAAYDVINGAFCIVMDPNTGAVLALASSPDYDLNDPNTVSDPVALARLAKLRRDPSVSQEEYDEAYKQAQFVQWRSKCLNTAYEPGSTFKPLVLAAALEEGAVTDSDTFSCTGAVNVGGSVIRCSARRGHGTQYLRQAVQNSCNPAFIRIGQKLGAQKFLDYWELYGFTEKTGIELPGEESSTFWGTEEFVSPAGITNLAVASFGQRFLVTPIQLITALSSVINGGHLMEPYLVQSVTDKDGNIISYHEPHQLRQVVSEETSAHVRDILESVVSAPRGTGKNAYVPGYRIAGKTGSSQNTDSVDHIIVSFLGFAPADDPQVIVLLAFDWPRPAVHEGNTIASGTYISGGTMAAPLAGRLIANILDYLGHQSTGVTAETNTGITVPNLTGYSLAEAQASLEGTELSYRTSGEGDIVTDQAPAAGSIVPRGTKVVFYLGTHRPEDMVVMPDLTGCTFDEVNQALEALGLYLNATGAMEEGVVISQAVEAGSPVQVGTSVSVQFASEAAREDEAVVEDGQGPAE